MKEKNSWWISVSAVHFEGGLENKWSVAFKRWWNPGPYQY